MIDCKPLPELSVLESRLEMSGRDVVWKDCPRKPFMNGKRAGKPERNGYITIKFQGENFRAHRIAWKLAHKKDPKGVIDHIDCDRQNNDPRNLQDVTTRVNLSLGYQRRGKQTSTGVSYRKRGNCEQYVAAARLDGRTVHLGSYKTEEEAHAAYSEFIQGLQDNLA